MFTKTVDKAIAPLLKAQKDLHAVAVDRSELIERNQKQMAELEDDNMAAIAERYRAERINKALAAITSNDILDPDALSDDPKE